MNDLIRNITTENYLELLHSFENSAKIFWDKKKNKLIHALEYGEYREDIVKKFLRLYIPEDLGISSGFLITSSGEISHQCDIIIYDKNKTPRIQNFEKQRFFPVETVLGVGEVKSTIRSIKELNEYLKKLSGLKKLREKIRHHVPYRRQFDSKSKLKYNEKYCEDNIFTFLMCYEFKIDFISKIDYGEIERKYWHNMILSLKDGLVTYKFKKSENYYAHIWTSYMLNINEKNEVYTHYNMCGFIKNDKKELPHHVVTFLNFLSYLVSYTSLYKIHLEYYLTNDDKLEDDLLNR